MNHTKEVVELDIYEKNPESPDHLRYKESIRISEWWKELEKHLPKKGSFVMPRFEYFQLIPGIPKSRRFPAFTRLVFYVTVGSESDRIQGGYFEKDRFHTIIVGKHFESREFSFAVVELLDALANGGTTQARLEELKSIVSSGEIPKVAGAAESAAIVSDIASCSETGKDVHTKRAIGRARKFLKWPKHTWRFLVS